MVNNRQALLHEYEQSLFRLAVFDASQKEGALMEPELLDDTDDGQPSPKQLTRLLKAVEHAEKTKKEVRPGRQQRFKTIHRIAASAAALLLVLTISMFTVDAFRYQVLNLFIKMEPEYTLVRLEEDIDIPWDDPVPTFVPDGFVISEALDMDTIKKIVYTAEYDEEQVIVFSDNVPTGSMNIDTETADSVTTVRINGADAMIVVKNGLANLVWTANNRLYSLIGPVSGDELIRMAESVR